MDFAAIGKVKEQDEEAVSLPIHQRNGEPYFALDGVTQTTFDVIGSESATYKRKRDAVVKKLAASGASAEEIEIAMTAAGVIGWNGPHADGKEIQFNAENLQAALALDHVRRQVSAGIGRYAGFFAKGS